MVRARAAADSNMLSPHSTCSGVSSMPPQIYDGRETSTRDAPEDVRKLTL
jgi:hypothetical protein